MDVQSFLKGFGYAAARTKYGVTASEIEAGLKKTESGCIVDCGSSIMLIVNARSKDGLVRTAAVAYAAELQKAGYATDPAYASKISQIAKQMKTYQSYASTGSLTHL